MPEEVKDVNAVEPSATEEVVEQGETTTPETVVDSQTQETSTQEVKPEVEQKPDRPEINYAMEAARKASEALEIVRQMQQNQTQQTAPQEPKYTKAQLRAFADSAADQSHKVWALEEIDKIEKTERQSEMRQLFDGYQKKTQEEGARQQSTNFVAQNFPECFVRDETGRPIKWDESNPLTARIGEYMRNPALAQNPEGLIAAAKMAAFDLGVSQNRKLANKVNQTTAQLRKEQKKTLINGGGSPAQPTNTNAKLLKLAEEYKRTGSKEAFKELAKAKGLIPQL